MAASPVRVGNRCPERSWVEQRFERCDKYLPVVMGFSL